MKFYNPFKWHIVQDALGCIYVRKLYLTEGWVYLSVNLNKYTELNDKTRGWCKFPDIESARLAVNTSNDKFKFIE